MADIRELIEASSLGTPEAVSMRFSVSQDEAAKVVERSRELRDDDDLIEQIDEEVIAALDHNDHILDTRFIAGWLTSAFTITPKES